MSKGTEKFKQVIKEYLEERAFGDPLFAETLQKDNKSLDGCVEYIIGEVSKSGKTGWTDDEIFGMAVHYYDEDDLKPSKKTGSLNKIVTNRQVRLTAKEIEELREQARQEVIAEEKAKMRKKKTSTKLSKNDKEEQSPTLF